MTCFGVITEVPPDDNRGNLATAIPLFLAGDGLTTTATPAPPEMQLGLLSPVFALGEIMVLDSEDCGREVGGAGRKPSKWAIRCEHFHSIEAAVARAREVT